MKALLKTAGTLVILFLGLNYGLTVLTERSADQKLFVAGKIPDPKPNGLYAGTVALYQGSWKGKKFVAKENRGINVFGEEEKYPFKTSVGPGVRDSATKVLKIDYDLPENPWWLRPVLDEIVETEKGKYLGKLSVRVPGFAFSLGFFRLQKS